MKTILNLELKIRELEKEVAKWKTRASHDALTGCLRRDAFLDLIEERRKMGWLGSDCTLAVLDADHFKKINDTYGHLAGDIVLKVLAERIAEILPEGSLLCRMGGEEFVALIPVSQNKAGEICESVRKNIAEKPIQIEGGTKLQVTISLGYTQWNTSRPIIEATARADEAVYRAKKGGRNRVAA